MTLLAGVGIAATAAPAAAGTTIDVHGSSGSALQAAIDRATPGSTIRVHAGTYRGPFEVRRGGPVTLTTAGDGPVTLTAGLKATACNAHAPTMNRTVVFDSGADGWTIQGFRIQGGIIARGTGAGDANRWFMKLAGMNDWKPRRALPSRGAANRSLSPQAVPALSKLLHTPMQTIDNLKIVNNDISGRGIHLAMARYGTISGNKIHDLACGTGPGMWIGTMSDGWSITHNSVSNVAASPNHWMHEGIRLSTSANYNTVTGNSVANMPGDSRAFTTDVDASFNNISGNTATNVNIGFNDQQGGWMNNWSSNRVTGFHGQGFLFRGLDAKLKLPSPNTSTYHAVVKCNVSVGGVDLSIGGIMGSSFSGNSFDAVQLAPNVQRYWSSQGNTWNGSKSAPSSHPSSARC